MPNRSSRDAAERPYSTATKVDAVGLGDMGGPIAKAIAGTEAMYEIFAKT